MFIYVYIYHIHTSKSIRLPIIQLIVDYVTFFLLQKNSSWKKYLRKDLILTKSCFIMNTSFLQNTKTFNYILKIIYT